MFNNYFVIVGNLLSSISAITDCTFTDTSLIVEKHVKSFSG